MSPAGASPAADSERNAMLVLRKRPAATWKEVKGGRTGGSSFLPVSRGLDGSCS